MPDSLVIHSVEELQYILDTSSNMPVSEKAAIRKIIFSMYPATDLNSRWRIMEVVTILFVIFLFVGYAIQLIRLWRYEKNELLKQHNQPTIEQPDYLIYNGSELQIDKDMIRNICSRYSSFYVSLMESQRELFTDRLQAFMAQKKFCIYGAGGCREMPVLLSATATQLGFGFPVFRLENYPFIAIHPNEYIALQPLRVLTGNVQGNTIAVSWKHFLNDNLNATDGNNVGLHEMAHAFAMQVLYTPAEWSWQSAVLFRNFQTELTAFIDPEKLQTHSFFDAYALRNADECWAKCVELFFEKQSLFKEKYPSLYNGVKAVLNQ